MEHDFLLMWETCIWFCLFNGKHSWTKLNVAGGFYTYLVLVQYIGEAQGQTFVTFKSWFCLKIALEWGNLDRPNPHPGVHPFICRCEQEDFRHCMALHPSPYWLITHRECSWDGWRRHDGSDCRMPCLEKAFESAKKNRKNVNGPTRATRWMRDRRLDEGRCR